MPIRLTKLILRPADSSRSFAVLRSWRTGEPSSGVEIDGYTIRFDLPMGVEQRVYMVDSERLGARAVELPRTGLVQVVSDLPAPAQGEVGLDVHFFSDGSMLKTREVQQGEGGTWYETGPEADGLSFSLRLRGMGELDVDSIQIVMPQPQGWMPSDSALVDALELARFPQGPMDWIHGSRAEVIDSSRVRLGDTPIDLNPPMDWGVGPDGDRTFQLALHGFAFAGVLLSRSDRSAAPLLADVLEDWRRTHPVRPHSTTEMSWNDMSVANRTMAILHVLNLCLRQCPQRVNLLADMAAEHAEWLASDRNYSWGHDHGLYSDTALEYAARVLRVHTLSARWRYRARERFSETLGQIFNEDEAVLLEHSPAYVEWIAQLFAHRRQNGLRDNLSSSLLEDLDRTLSILTTPNARLLPWGDTDHDHESRRTRPKGVFTFDVAGWGVSHLEEGTAAALTSGYHSRAHKHNDELSVLWYDDQGPIITEAGFPGYGYRGDERREFGTSVRGHNSVVINGCPAEWQGSEPFGSAIWRGASHGRWHVLGGYNPLQEEGAHERFVVHGPRTLVVVDILTSSGVHEVVRRFHIGPGIKLRLSEEGVVELGEWILQHWSEVRPATMSIDSGEADTRHFELSNERHHPVVVLRDRGPGVRVVTLGNTRESIEVTGIRVLGMGGLVRVDLILRGGDTIEFERRLADDGRGALKLIRVPNDF